ncbi:MAG: hypothetical protein Q8Q42_03815 [Nanoarchaeota archaeon]|nr:hypothetical protein [Nanoarchaeota archaeon]
MAGNSDLAMFFDIVCTHCHEMDPLVDDLEKKEGVIVRRLEVWHDDKNMTELKKYDDGECCGVQLTKNLRN